MAIKPRMGTQNALSTYTVFFFFNSTIKQNKELIVTTLLNLENIK